MGVIVDSSVVIAAERRGWTPRQLIEQVIVVCGQTDAALSAVGAVELLHGIWRAKDALMQERRTEFIERVLTALPVEPLTLRRSDRGQDRR